MAVRGISPATNNGADLGSDSKKWRKIYANAANNELNLGNNYSLGFRRPHYSYAVGAVRRWAGLSTFFGRQLVCVKAGVTADGDLEAESLQESSLIYDGSVVWAIDSYASYEKNEGHANSMFRGADITEYYESGLLAENLAAGLFVNVYPGDIIVKTISTAETAYTDKSGDAKIQPAATYSNLQWRVTGIDYYKDAGSPSITDHHIVLMAVRVQNGTKMNPTTDITGGYIGSDMWRVQMPIWTEAIENAFGAEHVLEFSEYLTNAVDTSAPSGAGGGLIGTASGTILTPVKVNIPSENMIFGSRIFGSAYDAVNFNDILPMFQYVDVRDIFARNRVHLRTISDQNHFTQIGTFGQVAQGTPNDGIYITPYFLYK